MTNTFYKMTNKNGDNMFAAYGNVRYEAGKTVEVTDFDASDSANGKGLCVCEKIDDLFIFIRGNPVTDIKVWGVSVEDEDILASDADKTRVKKLKVVREVGNEEIYGPNHLELFRLFDRVSSLPYGKPSKDLDLALVERLACEHLTELGKYAKPDAFSEITIKFVKTEKEYFIASSVAYSGPGGSIFLSSSESDMYVARKAATRAVGGAVGRVTWDAVRDAVGYATCDYVNDVLGHAKEGVPMCAAPDVAGRVARLAAKGLIADTPARPWMPLVEILALGCIPVWGLAGKEFVVWVP